LCLVALISLASLAFSEKEATKQNSRIVIFEVSSIFYESDQSRPHLSIEPIVIIEDGQYVEPPKKCDEIEAFGKSWFRLGAAYRLLYGGGEAGHVTVTKWLAPKPGECLENAAMVRMKSSRKLGRGEVALATNSKSLGHKRSSRRPPTTEEQAKLLKLGQEIFRANGVGEERLQSIVASGLAVIDVDGDGINEMLGSFYIYMKEEPDRHLFLLLEKQEGEYRPAISWYHSGSATETHSKTFIDNLDLDQDGIDELIIREMFVCEMTRYQIYKKKERQWQVVYESGGVKC
jgi:hypothetical protein